MDILKKLSSVLVIRMKAFAYIRVSTREQDEDIQRKAIEEFAYQRGIEVTGLFIDKGESGAKPFSERLGARQLLQKIGEQSIDAVIVWSINRLGRTMIDTLNTIQTLESKGVKVISIKEEWLQTLDDSVRRLVLSILSWVAEFERKRIRERQIEAWSKGKQKGRPKKLKLETVEKYLKRYNNMKLKDIWKIMKVDGINISYNTLRRYVKELGYIYVHGAWRKINITQNT
ncbi:MAG: recombinase family protein [Ignisphaera sp.]